MEYFKWVFIGGRQNAIENHIHHSLYIDFGTYPVKIGQELLRGMIFGLAEIPVSLNHGGGGEWWGGFVVCDTNT